MTESNTPHTDEPNVVSNEAKDFFAPEESNQLSSAPSRSKWLMPGAAVAGAALIAGLIGFTVGNHSDPDFRPAAVAGQLIPGQGGPGMDGDHGPGMDGQHKGKGHHGQRGHGNPEMMPGSPQGGIDISPKTPHCHDATGADVEVGANGLCADGSLPGMRGMSEVPASPVPSASSSTSIQ